MAIAALQKPSNWDARRIRAFRYCHVYVAVVGVGKIGDPLTLSRRYKMSTTDEIIKEKQRVSEALALIEAQREKLAGQLAELELTERVLARYSKGNRAKKTASATTLATKAAAPARSSGRQSTAAKKPAGSRRTEPTLADRVLALATGKTQQEIATACKGARPNHVGVVLARHKRAGRIEERDGKLYATQSAATGQAAAL
jgi:hypothetical protein